MTACFSFARYNPSFPRAHSTALSAADKHLVRSAQSRSERGFGLRVFRALHSPASAHRHSQLLRRAMKVSAHELIHTFGVHHCIYYECLMNGSNHLDETDARPVELCPVDLRKMQQVRADRTLM